MTSSLTSPPAVEFSNVSKTFPGQKALSDVSFSVRQGEIHALMGQNGSGKSTLIKILAGIYSSDRGSEIRVCGEPLILGSPRESRRVGLRFVHQALGIIDELTAVENIALGSGYSERLGKLIDWKAERARAKRLLARLAVDVDIDRPVSKLRAVERAAIAIARAIDDASGGTRVLVLDEPTAALPQNEVEALFQLVREARSSGAAVIYVSHRLQEVLDLADTATILRDGIRRETMSMASLTHSDLIKAIVGQDLGTEPATEAEAGVVTPIRPIVASSDTADALYVTDLMSDRLAGVTLAVKTGEILGIGGLTGSGREEIAGAIVGLRAATGGLRTRVGDEHVNPSPRAAKKMGVVLVLPNRAAGAAIKKFTILENVVLPSMRKYTRLGFRRRRREAKDTLGWIHALDIRPPDAGRAYELLSGGNQQKVVFSKWLNVNPVVIIAEDPTSGVDVGARRMIYDLMRDQAAKGTAFIVVSSDAEDLLSVCDRVLVLRDGVIAAELTGTEITESELLAVTLGK
jgi:ribose transport system ATP-binding protein